MVDLLLLFMHLFDFNMKKSKILLLFIFFVFLSCFLSSCRATRQEVQKQTNQTAIAKENIVTYRDTVLHTQKAETSLKIPVTEMVFKDSLKANAPAKIFTQKNGNATVKIKVLHDTIYATASCDSLSIVAKIKQQLKTENLKSESNQSDDIQTKTGYTLFIVIIDIIIAFAVGFAICFILKFFKIV